MTIELLIIVFALIVHFFHDIFCDDSSFYDCFYALGQAQILHCPVLTFYIYTKGKIWGYSQRRSQFFLFSRNVFWLISVIEIFALFISASTVSWCTNPFFRKVGRVMRHFHFRFRLLWDWSSQPLIFLVLILIRTN